MPTTSNITELDVVLAPPIKVRLDGKVYKLPGDIPLPLYFAVKAREEAEGENTDVVEALHRQLLELFQIHQPEMKVVPCGMVQLFEIIPMLYGPNKVDPTKPQGRSNGARGSAKRTSSASRRKNRSPS